MDIQPAFNSGEQGFHRAKETADQAAAEIVASTTYSVEETNATTTDINNEVNTEISNQASSSSDVPDLNQAIVNLKVAEFQAKASTEIIKSADDSLGTLLDVTA